MIIVDEDKYLHSSNMRRQFSHVRSYFTQYIVSLEDDFMYKEVPFIRCVYGVV